MVIAVTIENAVAAYDNFARPLAIFKETCELLVIVGSEKPHDNVPMTKGAFEDVDLPEASLFEIFESCSTD